MKIKRNFSSSEAKTLSKKMQDGLKNLAIISNASKNITQEVKDACDYVETDEALKILKSVPIEDLNNSKKGIRVKALRDAGYQNMAEIFTSSQYNLASVYGISDNAALTIKVQAEIMAKRAKEQVKIQLSYDNQNKSHTKLVKSISKYLTYQSFKERTDEILLLHKEEIEEYLKALEPATGSFKWLFTSKDKKQAAIDAYDNLVNIHKSYVFKDIVEITRKYLSLKNITKQKAWDDFKDKNIEFYNVIEEMDPGLLGTSDSLYGLPEDLAREIQEEAYFPDGLLCTLRKYQEWGVKYILHQGKVLLGDEMGLGKTIQAIATMVSLRNTGATHFIVVCPASVVVNWCREIIKHSKLKPTKIHGPGRANALKSWIRTGGVAVTTYETTSHFKFDDEFKYSLLVVDEAHYIKNPEANRTINTIELSKHAERLLFMTGTALENNVEEMIHLIEVLNLHVANEIRPCSFMSRAKEFRNKIAPVYYRRKREDVLTELPAKTEVEEWCTLNKDERKAYEDAIIDGHYMEARRLSWNVDNLNYSSKFTRLKELIEEAEAENRKAIVFSFFRDTIKKIYQFLYEKCVEPINGSVPAAKRQGIIDEFEKSSTKNVLVAQIQSGGTGLNIQGASVVIICEPQFKPSIENQAISRAYRMGQSRNVLVYRLLCEDTIDEKLIKVLKEKQAIFDAFADKSVAAEESLNIDNAQFGSIIKEEIERINKKRGISNVQAHIDESQLNEIEQDESSDNNADYYDKLMAMDYETLVQFLLTKHGPAHYDYFYNENCKSRNANISRSKEGLICHHIDEDKSIDLSNPLIAVTQPYEYQRASHLVYANQLEHLLLHIKIVEKCVDDISNGMLKGIGGIFNFICPKINDFYNGYIFTKEYDLIAMNMIKDDFDSYIKMLKLLLKTIHKNKILSSMFDEKSFACGWDGNLINKIYNAL